MRLLSFDCIETKIFIFLFFFGFYYFLECCVYTKELNLK